MQGPFQKRNNFRTGLSLITMMTGLLLFQTLFMAGIAEGKNLDTLSLYLENDYFAGDDSNYTNGLKLTYSSAIQENYPDVWPHRWFYPLIKKLPFEKSPDKRRNITISLGQNIYTPVDIEEEELIEDDRPYAGITYVSFGVHSSLKRDMDTLELHLGIVGPDSYAEQCQKAIHKIFDDIEPQGWDNQLNNEPILGIVYEHKKKITQSRSALGLGHDLIINTGGGLGNDMTYYNLGLNLRLGYNIPDDFGNYPIHPASAINGSFDTSDPRYSGQSNFGIFVFGASEGRAVLRNIFLDGNTFSDSHSVDSKPVVADCLTGVGIIAGPALISMAYVYRTKEFETQKEAQKFGSINVSVSF